MKRGAWRSVRVSLWGRREFTQLTTNAKVIYMALMTGSSSTFAGIAYVGTDTLMRETGLELGDVNAGSKELAHAPSTARSFIVHDPDNGIIWVRDRLRDDPTSEKGLNENHRKGLETALGGLPKDSPAVRKFRSYYGLTQGPVGGTRGGTGRATGRGSAHQPPIPIPKPIPIPIGQPVVNGFSSPNSNGHNETNYASKGQHYTQHPNYRTRRTDVERVIRGQGYSGMQVVNRLQEWDRALEAGGDLDDPGLVPA